jgi:hypothetical protein
MRRSRYAISFACQRPTEALSTMRPDAVSNAAVVSPASLCSRIRVGGSVSSISAMAQKSRSFDAGLALAAIFLGGSGRHSEMGTLASSTTGPKRSASGWAYSVAMPM